MTLNQAEQTELALDSDYHVDYIPLCWHPLVVYGSPSSSAGVIRGSRTPKGKGSANLRRVRYVVQVFPRMYLREVTPRFPRSPLFQHRHLGPIPIALLEAPSGSTDGHRTNMVATLQATETLNNLTLAIVDHVLYLHSTTFQTRKTLSQEGVGHTRHSSGIASTCPARKYRLPLIYVHAGNELSPVI